MFQSDDEITFDADFLSDAFDLASTTTSVECPKRNAAENEAPVLKKRCTSSQNKHTLDILTLLNSEVHNRVEKSPEHRFARPVLPTKKRRIVQRKFPGPAGILPTQKHVDVDLKRLENFDTVRSDDRSDSDELMCSQHSEDVFTRPAWRRMLQDLGSVPCGSAPGVVLPERYTIAWAKARATRRQLIGGRTPFLAAVVQQIDCSTKDPMAVLRDPTGEIQATVIHEVWEEYGELLHTGAVIVLRQVGVLSTAKRHYLAITLNNMFAIYSDAASGTSSAANSPPGEPVVTKINYMTSSDFIKTLSDIRNAKMPISSCENNSSVENNTAGLFSRAQRTLNDSNRPRRDTHQRPGLDSNAECSSNVRDAEHSHRQSRNDQLSRRDTPGHPPTNVPALFSTTEHTSNQLNSVRFTAASTISDTPTFLRSDFDRTTDKSPELSQESEMLSQILDGLDTESIFDDF